MWGNRRTALYRRERVKFFTILARTYLNFNLHYNVIVVTDLVTLTKGSYLKQSEGLPCILTLAGRIPGWRTWPSPPFGFQDGASKSLGLVYIASLGITTREIPRFVINCIWKVGMETEGCPFLDLGTGCRPAAEVTSNFFLELLYSCVHHVYICVHIQCMIHVCDHVQR